MWYFTWILGVTLAILLASMAAMMCDAKECAIEDAKRSTPPEA